MLARATSIRRPLALLTGPVLGCLIVLLLLQGQAVGKPAQKCGEGTERAGCKLPVGAEYDKQVKTGSAEGSITATVEANRARVIIYSAYIDCKKFAPNIGDMVGVADDYTLTKRPKIGKTYSIKDSVSRNDEFGFSKTDSELTLNFKSAKQLVVRLHQVSEADGELQCDGSKTWTLKRR